MPRLTFLLAVLLAPSTLLAQSPAKPSPAAHDMQQMMLNGAHEAAGFRPSADLDRDFAVMMRHQHKISIRLAEHELQHGKDPKAREIAKKIADAQKKEAAELDAWLKDRPAAK